MRSTPPSFWRLLIAKRMVPGSPKILLQVFFEIFTINKIILKILKAWKNLKKCARHESSPPSTLSISKAFLSQLKVWPTDFMHPLWHQAKIISISNINNSNLLKNLTILIGIVLIFIVFYCFFIVSGKMILFNQDFEKMHWELIFCFKTLEFWSWNLLSAMLTTSFKFETKLIFNYKLLNHIFLFLTYQWDIIKFKEFKLKVSFKNDTLFADTAPKLEFLQGEEFFIDFNFFKASTNFWVNKIFGFYKKNFILFSN